MKDKLEVTHENSPSDCVHTDLVTEKIIGLEKQKEDCLDVAFSLRLRNAALEDALDEIWGETEEEIIRRLVDKALERGDFEAPKESP